MAAPWVRGRLPGILSAGIALWFLSSFLRNVGGQRITSLWIGLLSVVITWLFFAKNEATRKWLAAVILIGYATYLWFLIISALPTGSTIWWVMLCAISLLLVVGAIDLVRRWSSEAAVFKD
ncbi:MAG: hypothetical protein QOH06_6041 [Acidobacteriota bacterium]|jgi:hypothetical protein|nr:hypothetical protein [Acidobacteriota bacterium]